MGASKSTLSNKVNLNINKLNSLIGNLPTKASIGSSLPNTLVESQPNIQDNGLNDLINKVKTSLNIYKLYDNYNIETNVINNDLTNKKNLQLKELKLKIQENDKLYNHILHSKYKLNKNKKINLYLLIFIIILVIAILILGILIYIKYIKY